MLVRVLESLNQTQGLINGASNWQIVHGNLTEDSFRIDNEQAAKKEVKITKNLSTYRKAIPASSFKTPKSRDN
jgi:hypothetical protein